MRERGRGGGGNQGRSKEEGGKGERGQRESSDMCARTPVSLEEGLREKEMDKHVRNGRERSKIIKSHSRICPRWSGNLDLSDARIPFHLPFLTSKDGDGQERGVRVRGRMEREKEEEEGFIHPSLIKDNSDMEAKCQREKGK